MLEVNLTRLKERALHLAQGHHDLRLNRLRTLRLIASVWPLLTACGIVENSRKQEQVSAAATCETACRKSEPCFQFALIAGEACADHCERASRSSFAISCGETFSELFSCLADSESCETPGCEREISGHNSCVIDGLVEPCVKDCRRASSCALAEDDSDECDVTCLVGAEEVLEGECASEYQSKIDCRASVESCDWDDFRPCDSDATLYEHCLE